MCVTILYVNNNKLSVISQVDFEEGSVYAALLLPCKNRELISDKSSGLYCK